MEGNQMKMRDALVFCLRIIGANGIRGNVFLDDIQEAHKAITAALSAPPRQCDVGTAEEQDNRMDVYCQTRKCGSCPLWDNANNGVRCEFTWAQMPYETQEGAEHGKA